MAGYGVGSDAHIKVTTEELVRKAAAVRRSIEIMQRNMQAITSAMEGTSGYWEGDAGMKGREDYKKRNEEIQKVLDLMKDYPSKLEEMAGFYSRAEDAGIQHAGALDSDIL